MGLLEPLGEIPEDCHPDEEHELDDRQILWTEFLGLVEEGEEHEERENQADKEEETGKPGESPRGFVEKEESAKEGHGVHLLLKRV